MNNPYLDLIKAILKNGKPWRRTIFFYYVAFMMAQAFLSLSPYSFGRTVDLLQHFTPNRLHEVIFWLSAGVISLLLFWLFHGPARIKEREVALKIQQAMRIRLYNQLTQLPLKWHQEHHSGNTISRINRASAALYRFAGEQFIYVEALIKVLFSCAFLLWLSLPIGLLNLLSCGIALGTVLIFDRKLIPLYTKQNEIENHVGAILFDYISNITTVLTLRLNELTSSNLFQRMLTIWPFYKKDAVLNEVKWFCVGVVLTTLQAIFLVVYIIHSLNLTGSVLIGSVVMIFRYQYDLNDVFFNFTSNYSELVRMDTDVKGLQPLLKDIEQLAHEPQSAALAYQWHTITINELDFQHIEKNINRQLFNRLTLTFNRGEKIALIGSSGCGKSTLLNIIRGLYTPKHAVLTIDGVEFDTLEPLQAITTLIPQDPEIFENTIAFNITMDVPASEAEINQAIQLASFTKVLGILPSGLETDIREKGLNLSVGQKQRLALARGLFAARSSSIILMDEPTSSVDLPTEKAILSGVLRTFHDATIIVSLHRLHLLSKFDRIIMIDQGKVVASGPASELLNSTGPVRELWENYQNNEPALSFENT